MIPGSETSSPQGRLHSYRRRRMVRCREGLITPLTATTGAVTDVRIAAHATASYPDIHVVYVIIVTVEDVCTC